MQNIKNEAMYCAYILIYMNTHTSEDFTDLIKLLENGPPYRYIYIYIKVIIHTLIKETHDEKKG